MKEESLTSPLFERVAAILEEARGSVVRSVNHHMVVAYWLIGREIVVEEQGGKERAEYGKQVVKELSKRLTDRFGRGFSVPNLQRFRQFFLAFEDRILDTVSRELTFSEFAPQRGAISQPTIGKGVTENDPRCGANPAPGFSSNLSWLHYRALMRVENRSARDFYESEAAASRWSVRELERQIHTLSHERLLKSRDKEAMLAEARAQADLRPLDVLKDPYVLEFLDLPESNRLTESDLEEALIGKLHDFLLELGSGFAFPRNAKPKDGDPVGRNDIKDLQTGTVQRTFTDNTLPTGAIERTITYVAPWTKCDREKDYETVWAALNEEG